MKNFFKWAGAVLIVAALICYIERYELYPWFIYATHDVVQYDDAKEDISLEVIDIIPGEPHGDGSYEFHIILENHSNQIIENVKLKIHEEVLWVGTISSHSVNTFTSDLNSIVGPNKHQEHALFPNEKYEGILYIDLGKIVEHPEQLLTLY